MVPSQGPFRWSLEQGGSLQGFADLPSILELSDHLHPLLCCHSVCPQDPVLLQSAVWLQGGCCHAAARTGSLGQGLCWSWPLIVAESQTYSGERACVRTAITQKSQPHDLHTPRSSCCDCPRAPSPISRPQLLTSFSVLREGGLWVLLLRGNRSAAEQDLDLGHFLS